MMEPPQTPPPKKKDMGTTISTTPAARTVAPSCTMFFLMASQVIKGARIRVTSSAKISTGLSPTIRSPMAASRMEGILIRVTRIKILSRTSLRGSITM